MTNLSYLSDGWLELESDPGLFTLLIEDFGCKNVQVEEIYDLSKVNLIDDHVYGFILLFKWIEERRSRHRQMFVNNTQNLSKNNKPDPQSFSEPYYVEDENLVNSIFFAHQLIPNSCATHAILSVLLNCNKIDIGANLNRLKQMTNLLDPESKGFAIGNDPIIARAHNLHASETDTQEKHNKQTTNNKTNNSFPRQSSGDSFHYISFVKINNNVYELDGLKKYPIDHGSIDENETFAEKFRKIILDRIPQQQQKENKLNLQLRKLQTDMNTNLNEDIRYSLMAVVPDRRKENSKRLKLLKSKKLMLLEILENLIKPTKLPEPYETHNYSKYLINKLTDKSQLEVNINKLIVKDINFNRNRSLNSEFTNHLTKENILMDNSFDGNLNDQLHQLNNKNEKEGRLNDDDDSTDTCSDCESPRISDDESDEETNKISKLYAFKFIPLKEQNNKEEDKNNFKNQFNDKKLANEEGNHLDDFKTFTKTELIDFYRDYGFKDLIKILNKIDQEISTCNRNINEEIEKRTKFYVDDSRRTHNYNDFITTYLLMITEQKKLHEFIELKDKAPVTQSVTNSFTNSTALNKASQLNDSLINSKNDEQYKEEDLPIKFFKEIITNYEDLLIEEEEVTTTIEKEPNLDDKSIKNSLINNSSIDNSLNETELNNQLPSKRKYLKRGSKTAINLNKRKERVI